jgi:hypothetical protein
MKTLTKLALAAVILCATFAAQAGSGRSSYSRSSYGSYGSSRSSSYVYRNPYAANPSVRVGGYYRRSGTSVMPHVRTPSNWTVKDNLNYRGYGTVRTPRNAFGW